MAKLLNMFVKKGAMKRKTLILIAFVLGLSWQTTLAQTEKEVSKIRSGVLRTNKLLSTFKKTTKMVDGVSLEGTEAIFYRSTAGLKKIQAKMFGETYNAKADFYYSDSGKLVFIFYRFNRYDTHIAETPPPKVVRIEEKRLYFSENKMIKRIITVTETSFDKSNSDSDQEILDLEEKFRKAIDK